MMKKVVLILLMLVVPMMAFSLFDDDKGSDKEYLELVSSIKDVVISTQKTRGLTNSFLNGNVSAQLLVFAQREEMMKEFDVTKKLLETTKLSQPYVLEAEDLMKRLKKLNKKAFRKNPAETFGDYTKVIEAWIDLNRKIIETQFKAGDKEIYLAVSTLNNTLLPLTENIGKLRGMGSGIVARKVCKEDERPKMQQFVTNIESYRSKMKVYLDGHPVSGLAPSDIETINNRIVTYTDLTQDEVIEQEEITLDANDFFDQGTACIGGVLKIYNALESDIKKKL